MYPFFTSSNVINKYVDEADYSGEFLIIGDGGTGNCKYYNGAFSASDHNYVLKPIDHKNTRLIRYFLMKDDYKVLNEGFKGVGIKNISKSYIGEIEYSKNSKYSDEFVVDSLDHINGEIDKLNKELFLFDELIKSRFIEMFGTPDESRFIKKKIIDTCKVITGNTPSRKISEYYGNYIEWIKTDNILSTQLYPSKANECLSEKGAIVGKVVDRNSILMVCIAGSLSSLGRVCITNKKVAFNQQINAIIPNEYNVYFLYELLRLSKEYIISDISMAVKGMLTKTKLENKEFILPPIELQNEFAKFVNQIDKLKFSRLVVNSMKFSKKIGGICA